MDGKEGERCFDDGLEDADMMLVVPEVPAIPILSTACPSSTVEAVPAIALQERTLAALGQTPERPTEHAFVPTFFIPKAGHTRRGGYWSHQLYQDDQGEKVKVTYCGTLQESEACAERFLNDTVLGFDMEWKISWGKARPDIKDNASLIQLASETEIGLFHIAQHKGDSIAELLAPSLKKVLESVYITKTGVNIVGADGRRLKKYLKIQPRGLFELSHLHKLVTYGTLEPHKVDKKIVSLEKLVLEHLLLQLDKGSEKRSSDWRGELTSEQRSYAGSDAYAGYQLFRVLNSKRLKMNPVSPLPAFAELGSATNGKPRSLKGKSWKSVGTTQDKRKSLIRHLEARGNNPSTKYIKDKNFILSGKALKKIARKPPSTLEDLSNIPAVRKCQVITYGDEILAAVKDSVKAMQQLQGDQTQATDAPPIATQDPAPQLTAASQSDISTIGPVPTIVPRDTPAPGLHSALHGLRIKLAHKLQLHLDHVATDQLLRAIALAQPRREEDLRAVESAPTLMAIAERGDVSLLAFVIKHAPAAVL